MWQAIAKVMILWCVFYTTLWLYFQSVITSVIQLNWVIPFLSKSQPSLLMEFPVKIFLITNQQILGNHFFQGSKITRIFFRIICRPTKALKKFELLRKRTSAQWFRIKNFHRNEDTSCVNKNLTFGRFIALWPLFYFLSCAIF